MNTTSWTKSMNLAASKRRRSRLIEIAILTVLALLIGVAVSSAQEPESSSSAAHGYQLELVVTSSLFALSEIHEEPAPRVSGEAPNSYSDSDARFPFSLEQPSVGLSVDANLMAVEAASTVPTGSMTRAEAATEDLELSFDSLALAITAESLTSWARISGSCEAPEVDLGSALVGLSIDLAPAPPIEIAQPVPPDTVALYLPGLSVVLNEQNVWSENDDTIGASVDALVMRFENFAIGPLTTISGTLVLAHSEAWVQCDELGGEEPPSEI